MTWSTATFGGASSNDGWETLGEEIFSPLPAIPSTDGGAISRVQFGTRVVLSSDGKRLLTSAPNFDYTFDTVNIQNVQENDGGGAVFVYDLKTSNGIEASTFDDDWELVWVTFGDSSNPIGDSIAMSPDGRLLAVRNEQSVQVFSASTKYEVDKEGKGYFEPLGNAILVSDACPNNRKGDMQLTNGFVLAIGCDTYDQGRGQVLAYELSSGIDGSDRDWNLITTVEGEIADGRFGWRLVVDASVHSSSRHFRLAVSAPNTFARTGLVRVFDVMVDGSVSKVGTDLAGAEPGDQFGFDLAMSHTSKTILAVGSPQGASTRGTISMYSYQRTIVGDVSWHLDQVISGSNDDERFGRNIALTRDGSRLAIGAYRYDSFRGVVIVYEKNHQQYNKQGSIIGEMALERWGTDVSFSNSGSILAAGSSFKRNNEGQVVGSVRVLLDQSPFCGHPYTGGHRDAFFTRDLCRDGGAPVTGSDKCMQLSPPQSNGNCVWVTSSVLPAPAQSPEPATNPTTAPSQLAPKNTDTKTPTVVPTFEPTEAPSSKKDPPSLSGCLCDTNGNCITGKLSQGVDLELCIGGGGRNMELVGVSSFRILQGNSRTVVMDEKGVHIEGASSICSGLFCQISTPIQSDFYQAEKDSSIIATGMIVISYPGGRQLRSFGTAFSRDLAEGGFAVKVELEDADNEENLEDEVGIKPKVWATLFVMVLLVIACCWCILRRRKAQNEEGFESRRGRRLFWKRSAN